MSSQSSREFSFNFKKRKLTSNSEQNDANVKSFSEISSNSQIFPNQILFHILEFLDSPFVISVIMRVSKQWLELAMNIPKSLTFVNKFNSAQVKMLSFECEFSLKNLTYLNISTHLLIFGTTIGTKGVEYLAASPYIQKLKVLNLQNQRIGFEGVKLLSQSENFQNLTELNLYGNEIHSDGIEHLAQSKYMQNLTLLDLSLNKIDEKGALYLAQSDHLGNLKTLYLHWNDIGSEGDEALRTSQKLKSLTSLKNWL
ncbi:hypothetical protein C9374_010056 [Naegleria lovaniensis]|uniref:F-box domain-containing protein n=1 Tax=Naegleria lovaniensis TaxID=51637 RepID=A0AA88KJN0_NAELO|nr:uncharacterized protein C9374_010056 [Naegleria lovaniensis]KAG2375052.1 hypothetical protein C9374_010056 [Naegleria lovaniensis]